jgi:antitoxin component YwqK of YwqJK toxin-antitoxin module
MKRAFLIFSLLLVVSGLSAQTNEACYLDSSLIESSTDRNGGVSYSVRQSLRKGDWTIYYDFALTKKRSEWHFLADGKRTGIWREFSAAGKLISEWNYSEMRLHNLPPGKEYHPDGTLKIDRNQSADTVYEYIYYPGGKQLKALSKYDNNGNWIYSRQHCENGQLIVEYNPSIPDPKPITRYHCNGKVKIEGTILVTGYTGKFKEYNDSGKLITDGQFTERPAGNTGFFIPQKTGEWVYYNNKGQVTKKEKWNNGRLVSTYK